MPTPLTEKQIQQLWQIARQTQWQYRMNEYTDAALKELFAAVKKAEKEIFTKLMKKASRLPEYSEKRFLKLLDEFSDMSLGIQAQLEGGISKLAGEVGAQAYLEHSDILSYGGAVADFAFIRMGAAQISAAVLTTPVGGRLLSGWLTNSFGNQLDKIRSETLSGRLIGEDLPTMVKRLQSNITGVTRREAEIIAKTYVQSQNIDALDAVAKKNDDLIKGWQWSSVTENGSYQTGRGICLQCLSLDAKKTVYEIGRGPEMPAHPNCRCMRVLVTKTFREMGIDADEFKNNWRRYSIRGNVNAETGEIMPQSVGTGGRNIIDSGTFIGSYEDFFQKQSEAIQRQTIGEKRFELYQSGKVSLSDLTDANGRLRKISEL